MNEKCSFRFKWNDALKRWESGSWYLSSNLVNDEFYMAALKESYDITFDNKD